MSSERLPGEAGIVSQYVETTPALDIVADQSPSKLVGIGNLLQRVHERARGLRTKLGRIAVTSMLVVSGTTTAFVAQESIGSRPAAAYDANTGDYPWWDATTLNSATSDYGYEVCPTNAGGCMTKTYTKNNKTYGQYDAWHYYFRNCTSYVAWRLNQEFYIGPTGLGNATKWDNNAYMGWAVDNTPEIGDIAHFEGNDNNQAVSPGHVAFVEEIGTGDNAGKVRLAEYNRGLDGKFTNTRWIATTAVSNFIDVNGVNPSGFTLRLSGGSSGGGSTPPTPPPKYDDFMIYRPSGGGTWFAKAGHNGANQINSAWGVMHGGWYGDKPFVGDFNGDGYSDYGIYRMEGSAGTWYVKSSARGEQTAIWGSVHGSPGDIPVVGDVDGDKFADFGIFRIEGNGVGRWYFKSSRTGQPTPVWGWDHGSPGDIPVVGDMNGDGVDDYGIYRVDAANQTGYWYFKSGGDGRTTPVWGWTAGGWPGDVPVVGKFTTDNVDDFGIYRVNPTNSTGYWYMKSGGNGHEIPEAWGVRHGSPGDVPLVGEFN